MKYETLRKYLPGLKTTARIGLKALVPASLVLLVGCAEEELTRGDFDQVMYGVEIPNTEGLGWVKDLDGDGDFDGITNEAHSKTLEVVTEEYTLSPDFHPAYTSGNAVVLDEEGTRMLNDLGRQIGNLGFKIYTLRQAQGDSGR